MKGNISISRRNDGVICLTIMDAASGRTAVSVEMNAQTLGEALTGAARLDVDFELPNRELIGLTKELKRVWVKDRGDKGPLLKKKDRAEGWEISSGGYGNHHNSRDVDGVRGFDVNLHRFVEPTDVFELED